MDEQLDYGYMNRVRTYYETADGSINATAEHFNITRTKVRKILITLGVISTDFSQEAEKLRMQGLSVKEIAKRLDCSISTVSTYLPYDSVMYNGEVKSRNAIRLVNFHRRVNNARNNTNKQVIAKEEEYAMAELKRKLAQEGKSSETGHGNADTPGREESGSDISNKTKCNDVIRLHLELVDTDNAGEVVSDDDRPWDKEVTEELHKYGGVKFGNHISRDILVPGDIELWALHYMIQRAFGWQNSHLHRFYLPRQRFTEVTDGTVGKWANLVGLIFRNPLMDEYSELWADDYKSGSFKTWLRRKYTGPYFCLNQEESYWYIRDHFREYQDYSMTDNPAVLGSDSGSEAGTARNVPYVVRWGQYQTNGGEKSPLFVKDCFPESKREEMERCYRKLDRAHRDGEFSRPKGIVKEEVLPWKDLPADALRLLYERPANELLERQEIQFVLALGEKGLPEEGYPFCNNGEYCGTYSEILNDTQEALEILGSDEDSPVNQPNIGTIAKEILYEYDFGDSWTVKITGSLDCADLVKNGRVTQEELDEAKLRVQNTYRPVMICRDGPDLVDDLGGYSSIACFLRAINGDYSKDNQQYEDRESTIEWAKGLGWSSRNVALKNRL